VAGISAARALILSGSPLSQAKDAVLPAPGSVSPSSYSSSAFDSSQDRIAEWYGHLRQRRPKEPITKREGSLSFYDNNPTINLFHSWIVNIIFDCTVTMIVILIVDFISRLH
jgi:hypothetical protein